MERLFDAWKGYLKTWDWWNSQSFQRYCLWNPQGGLQHHIWTPSCNDQHADACRVMAYSHKTQTFMENKGQQKCLDKALVISDPRHTECSNLKCYSGEKTMLLSKNIDMMSSTILIQLNFYLQKFIFYNAKINYSNH